MKSLKIALATVIALTAAAPAFAGTSVTNTNSYKRTYNGTSTTNVTVDKLVTGTVNNYSASIKAESYGGDVNTAQVSFDGVDLTGSAYSANTNPQDPVAIITYSQQTENLTIEKDSLNVTVVESYDFSGYEREHTVSSDSF